MKTKEVVFEVVGLDEPTDEAIAALARFLLSYVEREDREQQKPVEPEWDYFFP